MAEIIASEILKAVLEKLASEAFKTYDRSKRIHSELKKLETTLIKIQSLLNDASQKETTDEAVKQWLNDLQHLAYDIDDVLDDLATEDTRCKLDRESGTMTSKVRKLIPASFTNLSASCTSLPPLGQLPSLKELYIEDINEVKAMGSEFIGTGGAFTSLEVLELRNMKMLEAWSTDIRVVSFPCLKKLVIRGCPNLVQVSPGALPLLNILKVSECESAVLRSLVQVASKVKKFEIESILELSDVVWRGVIEYLGGVEVLSITNCNEIRYLWESEAKASKVLTNLRKLRVDECQNMVRLGEKEEDDCEHNPITTLRTVLIEDCESMEHCRCPNNTEMLFIGYCTSITSASFPTTGEQKFKSLEIDSCDKPLEKLQHVVLVALPFLTTIIELSHFIHLTNLAIDNCPNMESFPDHELPNLTSLTYLHIYNCPSTDDSFPRGLWPPKLQTLVIGWLKKPILEWGPQNFPTSLVRLGLCCGKSEEDDDVSRCSQLSHLLPSSLTTLRLDGFKKLKSVSVGLQHLTSLQHLFLSDCPKLKHLPDNLLPSLLSLNIEECPKLEGRCSRRGSYWSRISHIPCIRRNTESFISLVFPKDLRELHF